MFSRSSLLLCCLLLPAVLQAASPRLLPPRLKVGMSVEEALQLRRSTKEFAAGRTPTPMQVSQLLWAAVGVNRSETERRTIPSALASYGVTVYLADGRGVHRYLPETHALEELSLKNGVSGDIRGSLLKQAAYQGAPIVLLLVVDVDAYPQKYPEAARREWAATECGFVGQNVYLQAAALGLGTVFVAAIHKDVAREALSLKASQELLYAMPVGYPKEPERIK